MENVTLRKIMESAATKMLADFEATRGISHNLSKGLSREYSVMEEFLQPYLPSRYSIGSGIIIDAENKESRQQDLVIFDHFNSPLLLNMESVKIFFSESVFAVIEVKSSLDKAEIKDIVQKSASVWNLSKAVIAPIVLSANTIIPNIISQTLCVGICFESSLPVENIPGVIREERANCENGHALSLLCVLKDKNGKSGVIKNVKQDNLGETELLPTPTSRLAYSKFESGVDALLYTYLMLMEHLFEASKSYFMPNLHHYAEACGFGKTILTTPKEETKGAFYVDGEKKYSVDLSYRVSELTVKLFKEKNITNEEILELFYLLPNLPSNEAMITPQAKFYVDGFEYDFPRPYEVYQSVRRHLDTKSSKEDEELLIRFIELIRSIGNQHNNISMGEYKRSN